MTLEPGQVRINDLVMGRGTPYTVRNFNPWKRPIKSARSGPVPWGHGRWAGAQFRDAVPVPMTVIIMAADPADWVPLHDALAAAFDAIGTSSTEHELEWNLHDHNRLMIGRAEGLDADPQRAGIGMSVESCTFTAMDGVSYSAVEYTTELGLYRLTGGLSVPFSVPFSVHSVVEEGETTLTNAGTAPARILARIPGPVSQPQLVVIYPDGLARTLTLDLVLAEGEWLDIDTKTEKVLLNGSISRLPDAVGTFPMLLPGTSTVQYRASGPSASRAILRHRDTY